MTLEILILFGLIGTMIFLFFTEKLPVDLTAFVGLGVLILLGYLNPNEAFNGFSSPSVITMLSVFFISAALLQTGLADLMGEQIYKVVGSREVPLMIIVVLLASLLSAFVNNIAAAAVLLPAVSSLARVAKISPSRFLMPLSFGTLFGGMTTLVGTPPNIIASEMLKKRGLEPFTIFDFTPVGLAMVAMGTLYLVTVGRKLLPNRNMADEENRNRDLAAVYRLNDNLFSVKLPKDSVLAGKTLKEAELGATLGVQVVGIIHDGKKSLAPSADTVLHEEDVLVVQGSLEKLQERLGIAGVSIGQPDNVTLATARARLEMVRAEIEVGSDLIGKTLREAKFRSRFQALTIGIERAGEFLEGDLSVLRLLAGDILLLAASDKTVEPVLLASGSFKLHKLHRETLRAFRKQIFILNLGTSSSLIGSSLGSSRLSELVGLTVFGILRKDDMMVAVGPDVVMEANDHLYVVGEPSLVRHLVGLGPVEVYREPEDHSLESEKVGVTEAAVAPRSAVAGRTLAQLNFRETYGLSVLAIWRQGKALHANLGVLPLQFGDALLLQGPWRKIQLFASQPDFVVLSQQAHERRDMRKAPHALACLLIMIAMVVTGWQPIHVAAFLSATLVVLSGAITMQQAYRMIEWRALFLVAAILPLGSALEHSGGAALMAQFVTDHFASLGPYGILLGLCIAASVLSQCLDGAPAVVLLTPVVLQTAEHLNISPHTLMMGVALSASAAYMTPFSHKANLLVMGAGGYTTRDYLKVGTPLTIILILLKVILIPVFFPF